MILIALLIGILASTIGALPLGAANIAVLNTTLDQNTRQALKIAFAAGLAEVMLSIFAVHCNMEAKDFFEDNQWIQIVIAAIMLLAGVFFVYKAYVKSTSKPPKMKSKYLTGFLLGLVNPPVIIYWLLVINLINSRFDSLEITSSTTILIVFLVGVYLGKVLTLWGYAKMGKRLSDKMKQTQIKMNYIIGIGLVVIGCFQLGKLFVA